MIRFHELFGPKPTSGPSSAPDSDSQAGCLDTRTLPMLVATYADGWNAAAVEMEAGKTVAETQAALQKAWQDGRVKAFNAKVKPSFAQILPEGVEPKDATQRKQVAALWREFAAGLTEKPEVTEKIILNGGSVEIGGFKIPIISCEIIQDVTREPLGSPADAVKSSRKLTVEIEKIGVQLRGEINYLKTCVDERTKERDDLKAELDTAKAHLEAAEIRAESEDGARSRDTRESSPTRPPMPKRCRGRKRSARAIRRLQETYRRPCQWKL